MEPKIPWKLSSRNAQVDSRLLRSSARSSQFSEANLAQLSIISQSHAEKLRDDRAIPDLGRGDTRWRGREVEGLEMGFALI